MTGKTCTIGPNLYIYRNDQGVDLMTETFATLISRSQEAIAATMKDQDYNPVSVICGAVSVIVSELTIDNLAALVNDQPNILKYKPTDVYYEVQWPSGADIIRACVQIEVENGIDVTPFSAAVHKWFDHIYQPPQHLASKMRKILQAA